MTCKHEHGDSVLGIWICGECWNKLDERPQRLGFVSHGEEPGHRLRQEVVWRAAIRESVDGFTLSQFLMAMISHLRKFSEMSKHMALDIVLDLARCTDLPFGDPDLEWGRETAEELVEEDIQYWDSDGAPSNS